MTRFALALFVLASVTQTGCVVRTRAATRASTPPPTTTQVSQHRPAHTTQVTPGHATAPTPVAAPLGPVPPGGIRGHVRMQVACTRMACGPTNQCCNTCNLTVMLNPTEGGFVGRDIKLGGHGCRVDGCGQVTGCNLVDGALHTFERADVACRSGTCLGTVH